MNCDMCNQTAAEQCSRCLAAVYCSADCQRLDWEAHRYVCSAPTISTAVGLRKKDGPQPVTGERNFGKIAVEGFVFHDKGQEGDFVWMIRQPKYSKALFIFNDNQEQFDEFHKLLAKKNRLLPFDHACRKGSGNAAIRPYQCKKPPRAAGIPTGGMLPNRDGTGYSKRGYDNLWEAGTYIEEAFDYIRDLITTYDYDQVIYSKDEDNRFGSSIFEIGDDVERYIRVGLETRLRSNSYPS